MSEPSAEHRVVPTAAKQVTEGADDEALGAHRMLLSLRSLFAPEADPGARPAPAGEGGPLTGLEPPSPQHLTGEPIAVARTFAFIDITGFTAYCDGYGEHAAIALLTRFRTIVRDVSARRGVRVAKWLGDGVMLVGVEEGPVVATVAEVVLRTGAIGLDTHAGLAAGTVLLFEGDDYVGRPANLAARLCDAAEPGEILAAHIAEPLPGWVTCKGEVNVSIAGVGDVEGVRSVGVDDAVARQVLAGDGAAA